LFGDWWSLYLVGFDGRPTFNADGTAAGGGLIIFTLLTKICGGPRDYQSRILKPAGGEDILNNNERIK